MMKYANGVIQIILLIIVCSQCDNRYWKRIEKIPKRMKFYVLIQLIVGTFVFIVARCVIDEVIGLPNHEKLLEIYEIGLMYFLACRIGCFFYWKRDITVYKLTNVINEYKQVRKVTTEKVPRSAVKGLEFETAQRHIRYILERIEEDVKDIPEERLEIELCRKKKKQYISLAYYNMGEEKEQFEQTRVELKQCLKYLESRYEVKVSSKKHYEISKLYF